MKKLFKGVDMSLFLPPAILTLIIAILAIAFPNQFNTVASAALDFILTELGWFMGLVVILLFIVCMFAMCTKYGRIKLGGPDAKPIMKTPSWIFLSFTSAMAIGISFWGTAEPMMHFAQPAAMDGVEAYTIGAAQSSMLWSFHHWGFVFFAMYCGAGVLVAFAVHNMKLPFRCSSAIYPLVGDRIYGKTGKVFECIIILSIICSIASSLGMGALQIASGLEYAFDIKSTVFVAVAVILIMGVLYTVVAMTPVSGGMKLVGNFNMGLYIFLMVFVFVFGPTRFLIENLIASFGAYLQNIPSLMTNWDPYEMDGFVEQWTAFFWPWWLSACPITGLFLAQLAKGRTLRQFVMVNMVFPALFCILWMSVFGGAGIFMDLFEGTAIGQAIVEFGKEAATYELMRALPLPALTIIITLICAAISFNTKATSVSYTLASSVMRREYGNQEPPKPVIGFWGAAIAILTAVLMLAGGQMSLNNTQTASVICGLPVSALLILMSVGFFKQMFHCKKYDKVGTFDDPRYQSIVADQYDEPEPARIQAAADVQSST